MNGGSPGDRSPGARSRVVLDTRTLLHRTVEAIAQAKAHQRRGDELVFKALEHVVWSDYLLGESRLIADQLHAAVGRIAAIERANGAPPEKVLTLLKSMIIDANADKLGADARSLVDDVVRWGIESYYAA